MEQKARAKEIKELEEKERLLDEKLNAQKDEFKVIKEAEEKLWKKFRDNHRYSNSTSSVHMKVF